MKIRNLLYLLIIATFTACGTNATSTPQPTKEATIEAIVEATVEVTAEADPLVLAGKTTFTQFYEDVSFSCSTCHYINSNDRLLGPGLLSIEDRFEDYDVEDEDLESYIRTSILNPKLFIVPAESPYPENIMPTTYGDLFSEEEIDELVAYILSF